MAFANDMIAHLLAPNSSSALTFVFAVASQISAIERHGQVLFNSNNKQLASYFQSMKESRQLHSIGTVLLRTVHGILALIPYLDLLAGKTHDSKNRQLLHDFVCKKEISLAVMESVDLYLPARSLGSK
jgi:hypothetical protein